MLPVPLEVICFPCSSYPRPPSPQIFVIWVSTGAWVQAACLTRVFTASATLSTRSGTYWLSFIRPLHVQQMAAGHLVGNCFVNPVMSDCHPPCSLCGHCTSPVLSPVCQALSALQAGPVSSSRQPWEARGPLYSFYLWGNWGTKLFTDLLKVSGLVQPDWKAGCLIHRLRS